MYDYYLTSFIIVPHGITDLTKVSLQNIPLLIIIYLLSLISCGGLHEIVQYGHVILFLISSVFHFSQDFRYLKMSRYLSLMNGCIVIFIPCALFYYNYLIYAKNFMLFYMIFFHVPIHYIRIKATRRDLFIILVTTFISGIFGPSILEDIESNNIEGLNSVLGCGMVVGHISWNII